MSQRKEHNLQAARGCPNYAACPICYGCENKAVHLYEVCQLCQVPIDSHNHTAKSYMIKRSNFKVKLTPETIEEIKKIDKEVIVH